MQPKYERWIAKNYNTSEKCLNRCNIAVRDMISAFPELTVQVGIVNGVYHCWCRDEDHRIVDPTRKQLENFTGPRYQRQSTIKYELIASRFLEKDEYEPSTGAIFLNT